LNSLSACNYVPTPPFPIPPRIPVKRNIPSKRKPKASDGLPYDYLWPQCSIISDFQKRGYKTAGAVYLFHHAGRHGERMDALNHLVNIGMQKCGGGQKYWYTPPYRLRFVNARTAKQDWENDLYGAHYTQTRGALRVAIGRLLYDYSPDRVTQRELLELVRIKDKQLCHIVDQAVYDLINEAVANRNHLFFGTAQAIRPRSCSPPNRRLQRVGSSRR